MTNCDLPDKELQRTVNAIMSKNNRHFTILFVEGEVMARNIIRTFLRGSFDVLIAANSDEALEVSGRYEAPIDILLGDVELVGWAGLPLHWLVSIERPGIRILPIASDSRKPSRDGQPPFLSKPFQLGTLHSRLMEVLEEGHHNRSVIGCELMQSDRGRMQ